MSTGLAVFDTTVNETNQWLKSLEARLPACDRHQAYAAMRAVMHTLRDRLSPGGAMRLAAQLPLLLRGVFVEGWRPDDTPVRTHTANAFVEMVAAELPREFPYEAAVVARNVVDVMWSQMNGGAIEKIREELPRDIGVLWPDQGLFQ